MAHLSTALHTVLVLCLLLAATSGPRHATATPASNAACDAVSVPLTEAQLEALMNGQCFNCAAYLPHLNTALGGAHMLCPDRVVAFLANVRVETDGFANMVDPSTNRAGSLHLASQSFRRACAQIPELALAFAAEFSETCNTVSTEPCQCGSDAAAADVVARPEFTFEVGVWWFSTGASQMRGAPCADLRDDADEGIGLRESLISSAFPGTGFYKTASCTYGFSTDPTLDLRVQYYLHAMQIFFPSYAPPPSSHDVCTGLNVIELSTSDIQAMMGGECANCGTYTSHIMTALVEGHMACEYRSAAFLATVRVTSEGLTKLHDTASDYAGAIPIAPAAFRLACTQLPVLASAFASAFPACYTPCECGTDAEAAAIIAAPEHAFRVAVWWFAHGSRQVLGDPCADLRLDADVGQGVQSPVLTRQSPGTGVYKLAACTWGFLPDSLLNDRVAAYETARKHLDASYYTCTQCAMGEVVKTACTATTDTVCEVTQDCVLSEWASFSACTAACDGGTQRRIRTVLVPPSGGSSCDSLEEVKPCNSDPCSGGGGGGGGGDGCTGCAGDQVTVVACFGEVPAVCKAREPTVTPAGGVGAPMTVDVFTTTAASVLFSSQLLVTVDGSTPNCLLPAAPGTSQYSGFQATLQLQPGSHMVTAVACQSGLAPSTTARVNVTVLNPSEVQGIAKSIVANFTIADIDLTTASFTAPKRFGVRSALAAVLGMHRDRVLLQSIAHDKPSTVLVSARLQLNKVLVPHAADLDFGATSVVNTINARFADGSLLTALQTQGVVSAVAQVSLKTLESEETEYGSADGSDTTFLEDIENWCQPDCVEVGGVFGLGLLIVMLTCCCFCMLRSAGKRQDATFIQQLAPGKFEIYDKPDGSRVFRRIRNSVTSITYTHHADNSDSDGDGGAEAGFAVRKPRRVRKKATRNVIHPVRRPRGASKSPQKQRVAASGHERAGARHVAVNRSMRSIDGGAAYERVGTATSDESYDHNSPRGRGRGHNNNARHAEPATPPLSATSTAVTPRRDSGGSPLARSPRHGGGGGGDDRYHSQRQQQHSSHFGVEDRRAVADRTHRHAAGMQRAHTHYDVRRRDEERHIRHTASARDMVSHPRHDARARTSPRRGRSPQRAPREQAAHQHRARTPPRRGRSPQRAPREQAAHQHSPQRATPGRDRAAAGHPLKESRRRSPQRSQRAIVATQSRSRREQPPARPPQRSKRAVAQPHDAHTAAVDEPRGFVDDRPAYTSRKHLPKRDKSRRQVAASASGSSSGDDAGRMPDFTSPSFNSRDLGAYDGDDVRLGDAAPDVAPAIHLKTSKAHHHKRRGGGGAGASVGSGGGNPQPSGGSRRSRQRRTPQKPVSVAQLDGELSDSSVESATLDHNARTVYKHTPGRSWSTAKSSSALSKRGPLFGADRRSFLDDEGSDDGLI